MSNMSLDRPFSAPRNWLGIGLAITAGISATLASVPHLLG